MSRLFIAVLLLSMSSALMAKEAEPLASDPALEERVDAISSELRCLVCQNQTIADSHAELAIDLKNQVRDMVEQGQTQDQIVDYMVQRYGEFVRYRPAVNDTTILLWAGPFLLLLVGLIILAISLRNRNRLLADDAPLSAEDNEHLKAALADKNEGGEKQS